MEFHGNTTVKSVCMATFRCDECAETITTDLRQDAHAALPK
jgi:hypothetical protein